MFSSKVLAAGRQDVAIHTFTDDAEFKLALSTATKGVKDPIVLIGGGDGTLRRAVQIVKSSVRMGIVPLGTGNALAHELEIPINPEQAIEYAFSKAIERTVDYALFDNQCFVTVATFGLTTQIAKFVRNSPKGLFGRLVYLPALIRAVRFARQYPLSIHTDADKFEGTVIQCVIANTKLHGGPFRVTENAAIDDGKLSIYAVEAASRRELFQYGLSLIRGKQTTLPTVWSSESERATLELSAPRDFVLDGDPVRIRKAVVECVRHGLKLLA